MTKPLFDARSKRMTCLRFIIDFRSVLFSRFMVLIQSLIKDEHKSVDYSDNNFDLIVGSSFVDPFKPLKLSSSSPVQWGVSRVWVSG